MCYLLNALTLELLKFVELVLAILDDCAINPLTSGFDELLVLLLFNLQRTLFFRTIIRVSKGLDVFVYDTVVFEVGTYWSAVWNQVELLVTLYRQKTISRLFLFNR